VLLLFITFHVGTLHRWFGGRFDSQDAFSSTSAAIRLFWTTQGAGSMANRLIAWFYLLGITAAVYHLANGVSTSADVWDLTPTPACKRRFWSLCIVAGLGLAVTGLVAWYAFGMRPGPF
jgi:succinate dehydrogenase/fumarate reductase cytochrome b subunit